MKINFEVVSTVISQNCKNRSGTGLLFVTFLLAAISGCQPDASTPAFADGSETPNMSVAPDGRIILSWTEPTEDGHALRFAFHDGTSWSETMTAATGKGWFVNWADFPSVIALPNGDLAAHWLEREGPDTYAYGIRIVRSTDGGKSWEDPVIPHRDGTLTEHGFVSLYAVGDADLGAVWLDGRRMLDDGPMTLRSAIVARDGSLRNENELDGKACDCCQTGVAVTHGNPVVVYRDRGDDETRDVSVVRVTGDEWTVPVPLYEDNWTIAACPVNGPAITTADNAVAVAWFTAAKDEAQVNVAFSNDDGATFEPPIRIDHGLPLGRVHIVGLAGGDVLVSWLEDTESTTAILLKRVSPAGAVSDAVTVAATDSARASGFPRMAVREDDVLLAWTDPEPPGRVRLRAVQIPH